METRTLTEACLIPDALTYYSFLMDADIFYTHPHSFNHSHVLLRVDYLKKF